MSNFERVTIADLQVGDHFIRSGKLVAYDGASLGFPPQTPVSRLREGVVPATVHVPDIDGAPRRHLGVADVARELGVPTGTVTKWIARYPYDIGHHPVPTPDARIGDVLGWRENRIDEWRTWRAGMPGRGAGGGRPKKQVARKKTAAEERFDAEQYEALAPLREMAARRKRRRRQDS
ncbi:hypothetical protein ACIRPH_30000 [Nocardiopsis sp. NPDC101807]|uniref:hypothetical protein n=1 Tax=Nocardiopsis sp. NPDC101807 TaxID=3364339 RepID=UPI0038095DEB